MKPGRELDALIAQNIMKWRDVNINKDIVTGLPPGKRADEIVPKYSTDVGAVWELVVKINETQDLFHQKFYMLYDGFDLKLVVPGQPTSMVRVDPFEICKAALEAKSYAEKYETKGL